MINIVDTGLKILLLLVLLFFFHKKEDESSVTYKVRSSMNLDVDPCENFYQYSCGGWISNTDLPSDEARFVRSFSQLKQDTEEIIETIITSEKDEFLTKIYTECMKNDVTVVKKFLEENIFPKIDEIDETDVGNSILEFNAEYACKYGPAPFFSFSNEIDRNNPTHYIGHLEAGDSFSMPKAYYNVDSMVDSLSDHIKKQLINYDDSEPSVTQSNAFEIEKFLADSSMTNTELRDPYATNNLMSVAELTNISRNVDWDRFFRKLKQGVTFSTNYGINVPDIDYIIKMDSLFIESNAKILKNYMKWWFIKSTASMGSDEVQEENFNFFGKILEGAQERSSLKKRCINRIQANEQLGFLIGELYVSENFSENSKNKVKGILENIQSTIQKKIDEITWMDEMTKSKAKLKIGSITSMIGYPDHPELFRLSDAEKKKISSLSSYFDMKMKMHNIWMNKMELGLLDESINKNIWYMFPTMINAYFEPTMNQHVYPAAILQYPFFNESIPDAMMYGGIGVVIGHELFHSLDDEGSKYDENGVLKNWWSEETSNLWKEKVECIQNQYSQYEVVEGYYINGELTSGENIADNSGVKYSFSAFQSILGDSGKEYSELFPEFTNNQLFFIGFAQVWCTKATDEYYKQQVETDPHSPGEYRVIGTVVNSNEFSEAFQCETGSKMNPSEKCLLF